jgi:hypothetical protein
MHVCECILYNFKNHCVEEMLIGKPLIVLLSALSFFLLIHYKHNNRVYKCAHMTEPKNIIRRADSRMRPSIVLTETVVI